MLGEGARQHSDCPTWAGKGDGGRGCLHGLELSGSPAAWFLVLATEKNPGSLSEYWRALSKFPSASNKGCLLSLSPALQLLSAVTSMRSTLGVTPPRLSLTRTGFGRNFGLWPLACTLLLGLLSTYEGARGRSLFSMPSRAELQGEGPRLDWRRDGGNPTCSLSWFSSQVMQFVRLPPGSTRSHIIV